MHWGRRLVRFYTPGIYCALMDIFVALLSMMKIGHIRLNDLTTDFFVPRLASRLLQSKILDRILALIGPV